MIASSIRSSFKVPMSGFGELAAHLKAKGFPPRESWLKPYLETARSITPMSAHKQTVHFRILASDITTSVDAAQVKAFPSDILDAGIRERTVKDNVLVQVVDVEDIGDSRWNQIEKLESIERGESTRGREIVRSVPDEDDVSSKRSLGPHKLLLQDVKGKTVFAFESKPIEGVSLNMNIGVKMLLKNATVARGVILLEPHHVEFLGGKIEAQQKAWRDNRKARLLADIEAINDN